MREEIAAALCEIGPGAAPDGFHARFCFRSESPVFRGHFPGNPLLPAVFQIEVVRFAVEAFLGQEYMVLRIGRAKFARPIRPTESINMEATTRAADEGLSVQAHLSIAGVRAATISMLLGLRKMT